MLRLINYSRPALRVSASQSFLPSVLPLPLASNNARLSPASLRAGPAALRALTSSASAGLPPASTSPTAADIAEVRFSQRHALLQTSELLSRHLGSGHGGPIVSIPHPTIRIPLPGRGREYSTIRTNRVSALADQIAPDTVVDLRAIMDDLRDLELLDLWRGSGAKSGNGWKDAARALYPLWHTIDSPTPTSSNNSSTKATLADSTPTVTFAELQAALPAIYSLAWAVIGERLLTGKLARLDGLSKEDRAALLFLRVHGVGPRFAEKFVAAGARSYAGLERKCKLSRAQTIGLRHVDDINRLIPRSEMDLLRLALESAVASADPKFECQVLGSYRRGAAFSSDIDLAVRHKKFADGEDLEGGKVLMGKVLEALEERELIKKENQLTSGSKKYSGMIKLPDHVHFRRIDIRLAPYHSYPYMLLGSSGDALLMKFLRHTAKAKGLCLNEYGMGEKYDAVDANPNGFRPGTLRTVKNEKEIFALLGFPYLKPEDRDYSTWKDKYTEAGVDVSYVSKL